MNPKHAGTGPAAGTEEREAGSTVNELLMRRAQILSWMSRLEEVRDAEDQRVVDRVRSDYQARLQAVVGELSTHLETLRAELESALGRRGEAEERLQEREDALREARLRHRIGELAPETWEARRSGMEEEVARSTAERDEAALEVGRLQEVLSQIETGMLVAPLSGLDPEVTLAEGTPLPSRAASLREEAIESALSGLDAPDLPLLGVDGGPAEIVLDDDLEFLEELDRAIASSAADADGSGDTELLEEPEDDDDARPLKGTKCLECGYTNDAEAWYCGVCGVDLA